MNLGQLIERLQQEDPNRKVPIGFCNPHSHRGDYSELAFDVELDTDVRGLLSAAEYAVDQDFEGYKGGVYRMTMETECYLTTGNSMCGIEIDAELLDRLIRSSAVDRAWQAFQNEIKPVKTMVDKDKYEVTDDEQAGYVLAMRLLQSDLDLDDAEMSAIAYFTKPEVIRRVLREMK